MYCLQIQIKEKENLEEAIFFVFNSLATHNEMGHKSRFFFILHEKERHLFPQSSVTS